MSSQNERAIIGQVTEVPSSKMSLYEIVVQLIDSLQQGHAAASMSNEGVSELLRAIEGLISEVAFYKTINEHQARRFF